MSSHQLYLENETSYTALSSGVIHLLPVSKPATTGEHKSSYVATAPLVKRVRHVLQVLEVVDAVPGSLLPGGLSADHEVAVVEEEQPHDDGRHEDHQEAEEHQEVEPQPAQGIPGPSDGCPEERGKEVGQGGETLIQEPVRKNCYSVSGTVHQEIFIGNKFLSFN